MTHWPPNWCPCFYTCPHLLAALCILSTAARVALWKSNSDLITSLFKILQHVLTLLHERHGSYNNLQGLILFAPSLHMLISFIKFIILLIIYSLFQQNASLLY